MTKKRVLLTGASRGIGKGIKNVLEETGLYDLVTPTRQEMDLSNLESVNSYMTSAGDVDILINNAGMIKGNFTDESIKAKVFVNLVVPIKLTQLVAEGMKKKKWGRIVNVSSAAGILGHPTDSIYSATKFGINGYTKSMAKQLGKYNILINSICPGTTESDGLRSRLGEYDPDEMAAQLVPLQRISSPAEVAEFIKFLIGDKNTYITGAILAIDGGLTSSI